jgi:hypothetical protein
MLTIAEHTVEDTLLGPGAIILDLGCRGFLFMNELYEKHKYSVFGVDCDYYLEASPFHYLRLAITDFNGTVYVIRDDKDPQATKITKDKNQKGVKHAIPAMTLRSLMTMLGFYSADLIKIDIEGSEYEVIMSLTEPPAKQLSIEFHLHTKVYGDAQVKEMEDKLLSLGYYPAKHDKYPAHGLPANYWDSLWILK